MTALKTVLGSQVRHLCRTTVNSLAGGRNILVRFRGTQAFTDGKMVQLPKIMDLGEFAWDLAKALIGYAVHEVAHIRYTDFNEVKRSYDEGKLVRKFANCIEDYRIERLMSRTFKGTVSDLQSLRIYIHPDPDAPPPQWYADPRRCGPLALTWTGARLNGFANPKLDATLARLPQPVLVMIERWTIAMRDVSSTKEAVDLAIVFAEEAEAYAKALSNAADEIEDEDGSGPASKQQSPDDASSGSQTDQSSGDNADGDDADGDGASGDPFESAIDPSAEMEDLLDALANAIRESARETGKPEEDPDGEDGEVDPGKIIADIADTNDDAPAYDSEEHAASNDADNDGESGGPQPAKQAWNDHRIIPVDPVGDGSGMATMRTEATGVISTTARTIRRLLVAEDKKGVLRNRRSGDFDIRNISAIVRNTGTPYRKTWSRPSTSTLLATLVDMSGSMSGKPLMTAMTGALALTEATRGTQVENWIYGYTGYSPIVHLYEFADGQAAANLVQRRLDGYGRLGLGCTPTGEAMAALGTRMDYDIHDRRILLVLTDGDADNMPLCKATAEILQRRGIEVVAIGIRQDSVEHWAPVSHVIQDISELPAALLATIDPRKVRRLAA